MHPMKTKWELSLAIGYEIITERYYTRSLVVINRTWSPNQDQTLVTWSVRHNIFHCPSEHTNTVKPAVQTYCQTYPAFVCYPAEEKLCCDHLNCSSVRSSRTSINPLVWCLLSHNPLHLQPPSPGNTWVFENFPFP